MAKNKLANDLRTELVFDLIHAFDHLDSSSKIANFLEDLLTPTEVRNLSVRLRIAKMLLADISQREICTALKTSLITTNKVNNWLKMSGSGFKEVVSKLPTKWSRPQSLPKGPIEYHLPELVIESMGMVMSSTQNKLPKKLISLVRNK